jgi:hypothetical protein
MTMHRHPTVQRRLWCGGWRLVSAVVLLVVLGTIAVRLIAHQLTWLAAAGLGPAGPAWWVAPVEPGLWWVAVAATAVALIDAAGSRRFRRWAAAMVVALLTTILLAASLTCDHIGQAQQALAD